MLSIVQASTDSLGKKKYTQRKTWSPPNDDASSVVTVVVGVPVVDAVVVPIVVSIVAVVSVADVDDFTCAVAVAFAVVFAAILDKDLAAEPLGLALIDAAMFTRDRNVQGNISEYQA